MQNEEQTRLQTPRNQTEQTKKPDYAKVNLLDFLFGFFCLIVALGICFSRISLGSHSWDQVVIGMLLGLLTILWIDYDWIENLVLTKL